MDLQWPYIGHVNIKNHFTRSITKNHFHHSYIFSGPNNLGKYSIAKTFLHAILCEEKNGMKPCNTCTSCIYLKQGIHPDFHEIQREIDKDTKNLKKNISIDQIKQVQEKLSIKSFMNAYKAVLILEADTLSDKASNALLKTLEEPAKNTIIILILSNIQNVLKTIRSRSQIFHFYPLSLNEIYNHLISIGALRDTARNISKIANGRPGIAIEYYRNNKKFEDYIENMKKCELMLEIPLYKRLIVASEEISKIKKNASHTKEYVLTQLDTWAFLLRDILLAKNLCDDLVQNYFLEEKIKILAKNIGEEKLKNMIKNMYEAKTYIFQNVSPQYAYENFLIQI